MKIFKTKKTGKQNSGFSLVELVVAIGILAVIGTIVALLMTSSSKNYRRMSLEAQLQSEAQLVANAISEYAIDSYDAAAISADDPGSQYVNMDSKILVLKTNENDGTDWFTKEYIITLNDTTHELYLLDRKYVVDTTSLTPEQLAKNPNNYTAQVYPSNGSWQTWGSGTGAALLGSYITDFSVDLSHVTVDNIINFQLEYTKNERTYTGNYQVLMRNRAYADKETTPGAPTPSGSLMIGVNPKNVYVDIKGGQPGEKFYIDKIEDSASQSLGINSNAVTFSASVMSTKSGIGNDVNWDIGPEVTNAFDFTPSDGTTSQTGILKLKSETTNPGFTYDDITDDDFTISISKSYTESGNVISAAPKQAKVHLRRVKSINLIATSGATTWKKTYEDMGGVMSDETDTKGYCYADSYGNYQTLNLSASIIHKWVPYAGGLTWTLEMRPKGSKEWTSDVSARYARLAAAETDTSTTNSVIFGKSVTNGQIFRVKVKSKFDPSREATYIFGVAPWRQMTSDGIYSRGFYVNLNQYLLNTDFNAPGGENLNGNQQKLRDAINNNRNIRIRLATMGEQFEDNAIKLIQDEYGEWFMYVDYSSYMYSYGEQAIDFYSRGTKSVELYVELLDDAGNVIETLCNPVYYFVAPVHVHPAGSSNGVIVLSPGVNYDIKTQTEYYNILGEDYIGIYVNDGDKDEANYASATDDNYKKYEKMFSKNLNSGGMFDTDRYLTTQVTSGYGDVKNYVDVVNVTLTVKTPSNVRNANPMKVRVTADKYYKLVTGAYKDNVSKLKEMLSEHKSVNKWRYSNDDWYTSPMAEYTVITANVIGENTFIVGPSTISGDLKFNSTQIQQKKTKASAVDIDGYNSNGQKVTGIAKAYYSNGAYKCIYKGTVYTYNETYHTWSK